MNERFERIKAHVKRNKVAYASLGSAVLAASFTCLIMRGRHADVQCVSDTAETSVFVRPLTFFSKQGEITTNIINVLERDGRGHPGYIVHCKETGDVFASQKQAADAFNIPSAVLSLHIRGKLDDVNGLHFERISPAT